MGSLIETSQSQASWEFHEGTVGGASGKKVGRALQEVRIKRLEGQVRELKKAVKVEQARKWILGHMRWWCSFTAS